MFLRARVFAAIAVVVALALVGAGLARADGKRVAHHRSHCQPISSRLLRGHNFYLGSVRMCAVAINAINAARTRFASSATLLRSSTTSETGSDVCEPGGGGHPPEHP
jgi:hypothetical protein